MLVWAPGGKSVRLKTNVVGLFQLRSEEMAEKIKPPAENANPDPGPGPGPGPASACPSFLALELAQLQLVVVEGS